MKKIVIYTLADKRPDFIPLQNASFKKFIKDEYEYIILNNAIDSAERSDAIKVICERLGIKCVDVKVEEQFSRIGGEKVFNRRGGYTNANIACAYPIKWAWEKMCDDNKDKIFVIIDSDMFIMREISFNEEMLGFDAGYMLQHRGLTEKRTASLISYIWNGICLFDQSNVKNLKQIDWDCGKIGSWRKKIAVDVGGYSHYWLKDNKIKTRFISEYAIHNYGIEGDNVRLDCVLNGNYHFSFEYNRKDQLNFHYKSYEYEWDPEDGILPNFSTDFEKILKEKFISYFEKYILGKQTYPNPTFFGFIEFETYRSNSEPYIMHIKAGSNYTGFSREYGEQKLEFVKKTLNFEHVS